jgi:exodeoxyribonuclease V alpha subunit
MVLDTSGAEKPSQKNGAANTPVVLSGEIEQVRFHRTDTGYTIARVKLQGHDDSKVNVVAFLPSPRIGDLYQFKGSWVEHPKYGLQFQAVEFEAKPPVTVEGIKAYLTSEIDEIGPELAKRIVDAFGMDTFTIIDLEPHRLREVSGIGPKRAEAILNAWKDHTNLRDTFVFLYSQGIKAGLAAKVFKKYRSNTIDVIRNNPYRLAVDIPGVGFMTADRIAEKTGIARDAPERICGGILYVLDLAATQGHTYLPCRLLLQEASRLLGVDMGLISGNITELESMNYVYREKVRGKADSEDAIYLASLHHAEKHAAMNLSILNKADKSTPSVDPAGAISWMEDTYHMELSDLQREAVRCAAKNTCMVLTGGPGTGKTYTITAIIQMFEEVDARILLCAPTGRAAKRMTEATGMEASTIHRLLEFNPMKSEFQRNEGKPLEADLIIVDEFSMVDILLLHHLLGAITPGTTLVCVGDVDQLPSVGPGNCLKDMIASGIIPVVRLDTIFRQGLKSRIIVNSHRINQGKMPEVSQDGKGEYRFISEEDPEKILTEIIRQITVELPQKYGLDPLRDVQVLSPMHKGVLGVENLNRHLQQALNPEGLPYRKGNTEFRVGDKVMQTRNNYELEVFNGDIGFLMDINEKDGSLKVGYDDRVVLYSSSEADDLVIAYATTIHKAQGSEYTSVILPVHTQHYAMLARNLLYTAVTRGKRLVLTIGSVRAVKLSVENSRSKTRFTRFAQRLVGSACQGRQERELF